MLKFDQCLVTFVLVHLSVSEDFGVLMLSKYIDFGHLLTEIIASCLELLVLTDDFLEPV